ncbi:MAG: hypothetical protein WD075_01250 [Rhodospirillales bacterium]
MVVTQSGSHPLTHVAFTREDTYYSAQAYLKLVSLIEKLWPERNSNVVMIAMTLLYRSQKQGYETDISALSAALKIPRTSAHRLLNRWEEKKYVKLERRGRKTIVHLTAKSLDRLVEFYDLLIAESHNFRT